MVRILRSLLALKAPSKATGGARQRVKAVSGGEMEKSDTKDPTTEAIEAREVPKT